MKHFLRMASLSLTTLVASSALAIPAPPSPGPAHLLVDMTDLEANPLLSDQGMGAYRTFRVPLNRVKGLAVMVLWVQYTHANNGDITMTCRGARRQNSGTPSPTYELQICAVQLDGSCSLKPASKFVKAVTGSINYQILIGVHGTTNVECTVIHSAGTNGDRITVNGDLITL